MVGSYESARDRFAWNIPPQYNLGQAMSDAQIGRGDGTALIIVDKDWREYRYSFDYLSQYSNRLANFLLRSGHRAGECIAVMLQPSVEAAICHLAILKAGMISLPLSPAFTPTHRDRLEAAQATAILTSREVAELYRDGAPQQKLYAVRETGLSKPGELLEQQLAGERSDFAVAPTTARDPALLVFTAEPGGVTRGIVHSHGVVLGLLPALLFTKAPLSTDVSWTHFDWSWIGGLLIAFGAWHCGAAVLLEQRPSSDPSHLIELLRQFEVTRLSTAPKSLRMLQMAPPANLPPLTSITVAGGQPDPEAYEWARDQFGIELSELYGFNECLAVFGTGYLVPPSRGSIGKPALGQQVEILSESGEPVAPGELGTLAVRSPHPAMFLGYWKDEAATRARFSGDFFLTGDLAYKDEQGYFWYASSTDHSARSGGQQVFLSDIEQAFAGAEGVERCAAIGVPDAQMGETIVLWVELARAQNPSPAIQQQMADIAQKHLNAFQLPRRIRFVSEIPMTDGGKIHRGKMRRIELTHFAMLNPTVH